jgi:Tol biopolymer transport system component
MNLDGSNPVRVTQNRSYNQAPIFTPDGRRLLFLADARRSGRYELWEVETSGKNLRRVADRGLFERPLRWGR